MTRSSTADRYHVVVLRNVAIAYDVTRHDSFVFVVSDTDDVHLVRHHRTVAADDDLFRAWDAQTTVVWALTRTTTDAEDEAAERAAFWRIQGEWMNALADDGDVEQHHGPYQARHDH